jgi:multidrug efflux system outer membrane protein
VSARRRISALAGALLVSASLPACLLGPRYERPEISAPVNHRGLEGEAEPATLADSPWWEVFQDPVLQDLIRQALGGSFDLRIAAARVEEARARAGVAKSFLFPEVNLSGGYTNRQVSRLTEPPEDGGQEDRDFRNYDLGFTLAWEIDIFGRIRRQTESATAVFLATEEARRGVYITLVADVAQAYFDLRELDLELEISRRTLDVNDETVAFYRRRLEGGVSDKLELNQAVSNRSRTAAVIPELERQIFAQENLIRFLLGQAPGSIERGTALTDQYRAPAVPAGLPSALLDRRPDVREAEELLVAANADVGAAKALFFPTISLTGLFGGASRELSDLGDSDARVTSIAAGLFQPIFQSGRIKRNYEAAKAAFDQALASYQRAAFNSFREVADNLIAIEKLEAVRIEREAGVAALQDAADLSRKRYVAGLANYLEILIADQQLFDAELLLARTRGAQLGAVVSLYRALGGGWQQEGSDSPPADPAAAAPAAVEPAPTMP